MALLLELVQDTVSPDITRKISALVGETPAATDSAVRRATPAVLAGVVNSASTTAGAERVRALVTEGGWGADVLGNLGNRLAGGSGTGALLSSGARLVSSLFGNKTDGLTDLIASGTGVQRSSASTVLCLAAPIVMSVIGKQITARGLSASGLSTMLAGERTSLLGVLPAGVTGLLGLKASVRTAGEMPDTLTEAGAAGEPIVSERFEREPVSDREAMVDRAASPLTRWWPALLVGLAAVAMLFLLTRGRQADVASTRTEAPSASPRQLTSVTLPDGARVNVDQGGSVHQLSTYLADTSATDVPKRFVFDDLHFETGSTQLTADGQRTVGSLLAVLKAYPSVQVALEGHTDATGEAAANKTLSQQRAEAVKQTLVNGGVAADRVKAEGFGQERPVGDNNTEAGRARNRRLELVVVQR
jgi:outer membrane protein OmpA-like peptidoglycan-associated protein